MRKNHYTMVAKNAVKESLSHLNINDPIGIGCSGGADSLALLVALSKLYKKDRANLVHVVIVDHQLQEITNVVSKETEKVARSYGFTTHLIKVEVNETGGGAENDARVSRYAAFEQVIINEGLKAFLLAHTMNDQAEQVILGLVRGSGTKSISGMPEVRGIFVRPFLNALTRNDTETVCAEEDLDYWVDPHNSLEIYKRVSARNLINDLNKKMGVDLVPSLVKTSIIANEDSEALEFYARMSIKDFVYSIAGEKSNYYFEVTDLEMIPKAVRSRMFKLILEDLGVITDTVSFELINRVDVLITGWKGQGEVCFSNEVRVFRNDGKIFFVK